jgi:hypothetical protein
MSAVRHAGTEELLALRDGEGSEWAKAHVAECASCAGELYRLDQARSRLKALPAYAPPRDRWAEIAARARRERGRRRAQGLAGLAAAAVLAALTFVSLRPDGADRAELERAALSSAMARSQAMEQALRALAPELRALPGDAAGAAADLEERLAAVDAALEDPGAWRREPGRVVELWEQRAGILSALIDVHATRAAMAGL